MTTVQQADEVTEVGLLAAVVLGLVEGLTEFLPVSSTGHLIVAGKLLGVHNSTLEVGIQVGAITAILVLYGHRLLDAVRRFLARDASQPNLLVQLVLAAMPAALLGLVLDDWLDAHLFNTAVVATTTVVGGLLLWWLEAWLKGRAQPALELHQVSYRTAFLVGCFQCLALIPGTSRSGATIAGALLLGASRTAAAELSFLVGMPILYGACGLKLLKDFDAVRGPLLEPFLVATGVSFLAALLVVKPFVAFVRSHTFVPFAIYRILLGIALAVLCVNGTV